MINSRVETTGAATLIVGWRTTRYVHGRAVKAGGEVVSDLRRYAEEAAKKINTCSNKPYDPGDEPGESEFLTADRDDLLDTAVVEVLSTGASLPLATTQELRRTLAFYALILGNSPSRRCAFIKRGNPIKLAGKGLVALFDETLTRVTSPIFSFGPTYDVVVSGSNVWIFDQKNFEALFSETDIVLARTGEWVEELSNKIPIAPGSKIELAGRLRTNSTLRRKVQAILRSPHLARLTPDDIRKKMRRHNLDPKQLMQGDEVIFTREHESDLLHLLNEDLFIGDFSGEQYAAARKARRG